MAVSFRGTNNHVESKEMTVSTNLDIGTWGDSLDMLRNVEFCVTGSRPPYRS
jgi:hypothetical protein